MQRTLASGFDDSFRRHLAVEQRRAVLDTIARELTPDTTLGDIVDAAQDLGWGDSLGELRLADLAGALLGDAPPAAPAHRGPDIKEDAHEDEEEGEDEQDDDELDAADDDASDEDADDDDDEQDDEDEEDDEQDEEVEVEAAPARRGRKPAARAEPDSRAAPPRKPSSLDRALDRIDKALAARGRKSRPEARAAAKKTAPAPTPAPTKAASKKAASKKAASKKVPAKKVVAPLPDDDTDAMSLDQAAKMLVPLVRKLREATMQDLEEQTGMGRRKLRFHIGQLVKHGRLKRHGMGRGTCYTVK